jgi:hypothetical protein
MRMWVQDSERLAFLLERLGPRKTSPHAGPTRLIVRGDAWGALHTCDASARGVRKGHWIPTAGGSPASGASCYAADMFDILFSIRASATLVVAVVLLHEFPSEAAEFVLGGAGRRVML